MTHLWYFIFTVASLEPPSLNVYSPSGPLTLAGLVSVTYGNDDQIVPLPFLSQVFFYDGQWGSYIGPPSGDSQVEWNKDL